jgi:hypothetical protein
MPDDATPAPLTQQTTTTDDDAWLTGKTQTRQQPEWASEGYHYTERPERAATPAPLDVFCAADCGCAGGQSPRTCQFVPGCRRCAPVAPLSVPISIGLLNSDHGFRIQTLASGEQDCRCWFHVAARKAIEVPAVHPESIGPTGLLVGDRPSEVGVATVDLAAVTPLDEMSDTDRLAALLESIDWEPFWVEGPMDDDGSREMNFDDQALAARLIAAGVTLAATPAPLDVERLRRALLACGWPTVAKPRYADAIAREYAKEPS